MRLLIFSDLHAHSFRPYSEELPNGRNSRLQDSLNVLEEIYLACKVLSVEGVLFGGDLFHARSILNVATFNDVYEAIAKIKTIVKFFVMVVGNHDQSNKLGTIHSTKTFNAVVDVIDRPFWYTGATDHELVNIYAIPYSDSKDKIVEAVTDGIDDQALDNLGDGPRIMLGHFGVSGAEPGANFVLRSPNLPTLPDLVPEAFSQVFLGHYHMSQELMPNVRFVGSTHQHNWGDTCQTRGVWIWDTTDGNKYSVPAQLELKAPKFVRVPYLGWPVDSRNLHNNFARIVFDQHVKLQDWEMIKKVVLEDHKARWAEFWMELAASQSVQATGPYTPNMDIEDMLDPFVDDEDTDELDKAVLKEMGHEFIRSCR